MSRANWAIRIGAALTSAVVLGAAVMSWDALSWGAGQLGVDARLTWLYPVVIDGVIGVATVAALALRSARYGIRAYVWTMLAGGIGASVVGNGAHAAGGSVIHVVGAAVPAVALAASLHLLIVLVRHAPAARPLAGDQVVAVAGDRIGRALDEAQALAAPDGGPAGTYELREHIRADLAKRDARAGQRPTKRRARTSKRAANGTRHDQMRALLAEPGGRSLTGRELGERLGIDAGRARSLRAEVERADAEAGRRPHVVEVEAAAPAAAAVAEEVTG